MKVRELLEELKAVDPEAEVIMSSDGEGNSHSPLASLWIGSYEAYTTWSGGVGFAAMTPELREQGYGDEDILEGAPAVILAPTN